MAEQIFEWWVSSKPFEVWYSEKFRQLKIGFDDDGSDAPEE